MKLIRPSDRSPRNIDLLSRLGNIRRCGTIGGNRLRQSRQGIQTKKKVGKYEENAAIIGGIGSGIA